MMVGWAKALKRAKCFEEEVELSVEEMRRTLLFFLWRAAEWTWHSQLDGFSGKGFLDDILEGLQTYTFRQSAMFQELIKVFVSDWLASLKPKGLGAEWLAQYLEFIVVWTGQNRVTSIIPPISPQPDAEPEDVILSDLDKALKQKERSVCMDQDVLHNSCVQILAEE